MHEIDLWFCNCPVVCILRGGCYIQARFNAEACAPYPGKPNYPVPAIIYQVERRPCYILITHWLNTNSMGYWTIAWWGKYENTGL